MRHAVIALLLVAVVPCFAQFPVYDSVAAANNIKAKYSKLDSMKAECATASIFTQDACIKRIRALEKEILAANGNPNTHRPLTDIDRKQLQIDSVIAACKQQPLRYREQCMQSNMKTIAAMNNQIDSMKAVALSNSPYNYGIQKAGNNLESSANLFLASMLCSAVGAIITMTGNYQAGGVVGLISIPLTISAVVKMKSAGTKLNETTGLK